MMRRRKNLFSAGQAVNSSAPARGGRRILVSLISIVVVGTGLTYGAQWMQALPASPSSGTAGTVLVPLALPGTDSSTQSPLANDLDGIAAAALPGSGSTTDSARVQASAPASDPNQGDDEASARSLSDDSSSSTPPLRIRPVKVETGDSLFNIFRAQGFPVRLLSHLVESGPAGKRLNHLQPGQELQFGVDGEGQLRQVLLLDDGHATRFSRGDGDQFQASRVDLPARSPTDSTAQQYVEEAEAEQPDSDTARLTAATDPVQVRVAPGDSFYHLFKRQGFSETQFASLLDDDVLRDELTRIRPGQRFNFHADPQGQLQRLEYEIEPERSLRVDRVGDGFQSAFVDTELERRVTNASGAISSSLFLAGQSAGLSDKLIMHMADIFGWDIDFALDIRGGDRFTVIYSEMYKDGEKVKNGPILAAEFVNQGRTVRALRFQDEEGRVGYFTPDGLSMRKAFLRTPVKFSRISSGFDLNRLHPVLHTIRAHRGVDYAAPRGTPITATGDGKVAFAGRKGGYGKTIVLRHGGTYTTLYAHLHNFARGIRTGSNVNQGQVIGYVGSTGLATGPHLHYEFRVNGAHKNPVTVELPKAMPIDPGYRLAFEKQTRGWLAQLDIISSTQVAKAE